MRLQRRRAAGSSQAARRLRRMARDAPTTWILTGSPENFAATRERGFRLIGMKERRRSQALEMAPGDRIVFYLTQIGVFAGSVLLTSEMFEDREPVWPGKPGNPDAYPWRFRCEPEIVLDEREWVDAAELKDELEHVAQVACRALEARLPGPAAHGLAGRRPAARRSPALAGRRRGMTSTRAGACRGAGH